MVLEKIQIKTEKDNFSIPFEINDVFLPELKKIYLFTINHKTAPISVREKFAIPEYSLTNSIQLLKNNTSLNSFLLLSTCNRTEIYVRSDSLEYTLKEIFNFFGNHLNVEERLIKEYHLILNAKEAIKHAFKVACGLESLVVGESQVLSQLKSAYSQAQQHQTLDNTLEKLFQTSIQIAKEIHKETDLSKNSQSISSAAVEIADKKAGPLKTKSIMVLGAGKMAKLALEHIVKVGGSKETVVLNRSPHRTIEFSEKYKTDRSVAFENIYEEMNNVDIIIAATGAPHFIVFADQFEKVRKDKNKPLIIFDISMPRNIDPKFARLNNIKIVDIDGLQLNQTSSTNQNSLELTYSIIKKGINQYFKTIESESSSSVIKSLRENLEKIRKNKLTKLIGTKESFTKEELDYITQNIINTILHKPTINIKNSRQYGSQKDKIQVLKDLFDL